MRGSIGWITVGNDRMTLWPRLVATSAIPPAASARCTGRHWRPVEAGDPQTEDGYLIGPIDVEASDEAFDARCALEIAVAEATVAKASEDDLFELRRRVGALQEIVAREHPDLDSFLQASKAFHDCLVGLSKNKTLMQFHEHLGIAAIWARALDGTDWPRTVMPNHLTELFGQIVDAYAVGDVEAVMHLIHVHTDAMKRLAREAIDAADRTL